MSQTKVSLIKDQVIDLSHLKSNHGITTDHIGEGSTRQYFTESRVQNILTTNNYITTSDVPNLETVTSLSINANVLSYTNEAGVTTNIDLSVYLDDTNLARIVSGTLSPVTGIATFTRDDSSTFTVDFSAFLSDANDYVTSASFNTTSGVLTLTRLGGGTVTVDLDGKYSVIGHAHSWTEITDKPTALSAFTNDLGNYGGFLTSETDPTVPAHVKAITATQVSNWDTAYGWGNHAGLYQPLSATLSRFSESNWAGGGSYPGYTFTGGNTRFGLSSTAGVVDLYIDGNFYATDSSRRVWHAGDFSSTNISNWNTAYGWGNHANAGYLTSFTESDPIYTSERDSLLLNKMVHATLLFSTLSDYNKPSGYSTMIQPSSYQNPLPSHGYYHIIARRDTQGGYGALLQSYDSHHIYHGNTTQSTVDINWYKLWTSGDFTSTNISNWNTAYGWGNHASAGYLTSFTETDPTVPAHVKSITSTNISNWNTAYGWGNHASAGYLTSLPSHTHPYLSDNSDSEQTIGSRINYFNFGGLRMNMDPRWNEGGYDGDNGNLHIWSTRSDGGNYGRAGIALYNGSAYQYLTTKSGQNALYHNNSQIITASNKDSYTYPPSSHTHDDRYYTEAESDSRFINASGDTMSGTLTLSSISGTDQVVENTYGAYLHLGAWGVGRTDATAVLVNTAYRADYADSLFNMNISRFTNDAGYQLASSAITTSNISSQSVNYANSAGSVAWGNVTSKPSTYDEAYSLDIADTRAGQRMPTDVPEYRVSAEFTNQITSGWHSLINVKGWHDGYATWQLIGGSDTSSHNNLYFRSGVNSSWGSLNTIWHSGNSNSYSQNWYANAFYYDDWVRNHSNNNGIYWSNTGWHLYPKNSSDFYLRSGASDATIQFMRNGTASAYIHNASDNAIGFLTTARGWSLRVDDSRNVWAYGSMRSPIFYDDNDTSYYVDPASTNRSGNLRGNLHFNDYGAGVVGVYTSTRYQGVFAMGDAYKLPLDGSSTGTLYGLAWSHPNAGGVAGNLNTHGLLAMENGTWLASLCSSTRAASDMRAPLFYDLNNTGYYTDPAGTSRLNLVDANDVITQSRQANPRWDTAFYVLQAQHWYGDSSSQDMYLGESGNRIIVRGRIDSPVFYDYNDTNVRLDSTRLVLRGDDPTVVFRDTNHTSAMWHVNSHRMYLLRGAGDTESWTQVGGQWPVYWDLGNNNAFFGGVVNAASSVSAPIFYDSDNTAYYVNPATQSYLNGPVGISTAPESGVGLKIQGGSNGGLGLKILGGSFASSMAIETPTYGSGIAFKHTGSFNANFAAFTYGTNNVGSITVSSTSTAYNTSSDYRLKENVIPMTNAIERVSLLKPSRFNFIGDDKTVDGFIAHEAQEVVPEAVTGEKDGIGWDGNPEYQGIDQSKLVPLLTAALQEAIAKIESLESRIQALETQ